MKVLLVRLTLTLVLVTAGVGTWWLAGGGQASREARDPHAQGAAGPGRTAVLQAAEAVGARSSRPELVARGRRLFRSSAVALDGESCQSCHTDGAANAALGTIRHPQFEGDFTGPRDPPSLFGVGRTPPFRWDGAIPTLLEMAVDTVRNHFRPEFKDDEAEVAEQAAALVAYLETLEPPPTSFDDGTMPAAALRGEVLFQGKAGCIACHGGPLFTDNDIHDTGVPQAPGARDPGAPPPPATPEHPATPGPFVNTPMLRDLRGSAPYMHNGVFRTLREVVEFYNTSSLVSPLRLTEPEIADLVAFLAEL